MKIYFVIKQSNKNSFPFLGCFLYAVHFDFINWSFMFIFNRFTNPDIVINFIGLYYYNFYFIVKYSLFNSA